MINTFEGPGRPFDELHQLRIDRDHEWEMAGLARMDGDRADEKRHTDNARGLQKKIGEKIRQSD